MKQPRWNEGRLDDLNRKVDDGFKRLEARLEHLDAKFDRKFDRLQLTLITSAAGIIVALIGAPHL